MGGWIELMTPSLTMALSGSENRVTPTKAWPTPVSIMKGPATRLMQERTITPAVQPTGHFQKGPQHVQKSRAVAAEIGDVRLARDDDELLVADRQLVVVGQQVRLGRDAVMLGLDGNIIRPSPTSPRPSSPPGAEREFAQIAPQRSPPPPGEGTGEVGCCLRFHVTQFCSRPV